MIVTIVLSSLILLTSTGLGVFANLKRKTAASEGVNWSYSIKADDDLNWDDD